MGKNFRKIVLMGTLPFLLGVGGCSLFQSEPANRETENSVRQRQAVLDDVIIDDFDPDADLYVPCRSDEEICENADGYLTQKFTRTGNMADDSSISVSRPASRNAVSVKDKRIARTTSGAGVAGRNVSRTEQTGTEDKVLYTTIAIPEEIGTNTETETVVTTTKVAKNPAESASVVPLKKTVTTVTETTTKVKQEKEKKSKSETLADKVAYGESIQEWNAGAGNTLRGLLMAWGTKSGWTVVWKLDRDYHLEAGVVFRGTFVDVSSALIRSFARATPAPIGTFHQGNRVLVISTQEDENER